MSGEIIIPFEYEDIICERLGSVFVKKNGKWGIVDDENRPLLPCKYDYIAYAWDEDSQDGRNYVVVQNDKFGKVTRTGEEIFPCLYDGITTWVEYGPDGHFVMIGNKMGLIDYNGKIVIPIQYESIGWLSGTKWAMIYDNGKMGLCDKENGEIFLPLEYDSLFVDYFWLVPDKPIRIVTYKNNIINILDEKGNILQSNVQETRVKRKI